MFVTYSDFSTGYYKISTNNFTQTELTAYITRVETKYLKELLGIELYNLFVDSIVSSLPTGVYLTIYNALEYDNTQGGIYTGGILSGGMDLSAKIIISEGIKEMLKGFLFFEYNRDQPITNTIAGNVKQSNENSEVVNGWKAGINERYNKAVDNYTAIQAYIQDNLSAYSTFNGVSKGKIFY